MVIANNVQKYNVCTKYVTFYAHFCVYFDFHKNYVAFN